MRGRRTIAWIIAVAVVALPLLLCSTANAESGCHRNEGGPSGGTVVARGSADTG